MVSELAELVVCLVISLLFIKFFVLGSIARPNDNIIFEESNAVKDPIPPFPKLLPQESSSTLPPFPTLDSRLIRPEELNALMIDGGQGYVYDKPEIPFEPQPKDSNNNFEGYFYDRPKNPMTLLPTTATSTTTEETNVEIDLPDGAARILRRRR